MSPSEHKTSALDLHPVYVTLSYILATSVLLAVYGLVWLFARSWMVMSYDQLWKSGSSITQALHKVWFIFAWGGGLTLAVGFLLIRRKPRDHNPGEAFIRGLWLSVNAGFFEELMFRWLIFFTAMVTLRALNFLTLGFIKLLYTSALIPLANWATFGALQHQLLHQHYWLLGAAIVSSNSDFRDGHKHLGIVGYVNSWFIGMVMFYLVFNYGLAAAIVAHILYDVCVFSAEALVCAFQPQPLRRRFLIPYRTGGSRSAREVERDWYRRMHSASE